MHFQMTFWPVLLGLVTVVLASPIVHDEYREPSPYLPYTYSPDYYRDWMRDKRRPEMTSRGIHGDAFTELSKRRPEMDTNGFYGDTFNSGFGDFYPARRSLGSPSSNKLKMAAVRYLVHKRDGADKLVKRLMGNSDGFYGDTFSDGFGDFSTTKKKRTMGSMNAFHSDTFSDGFGDFSTL